LEVSGSYTVKEPLTLTINATEDKIRLGENITVNGVLTPNNNSTVGVQFSSINSTQTINCTVDGKGTFVATFRPNSLGLWAVTATCLETQTSYRADSQQLMITVTPPPFYVKYSLFIMAGFVAAIAAGGVVYFLKFRGK
jgi:predicted anti-sigma-YlaC factor YlaD